MVYFLSKAEGQNVSCVRRKNCFERATAFSILLKKEERAGERRRLLSISPLSDSLPTRSSRGERGKTPQAFCVPNTTGETPADGGNDFRRVLPQDCAKRSARQSCNGTARGRSCTFLFAPQAGHQQALPSS